MKKQQGNYIQLPRTILNRINEFSDGEFKLMIYLKNLEHKFSGSEKNYFFQTNEELAEALNWNIKTLKKHKKGLKDKFPDIITMETKRWELKNGKKSSAPKTKYTFLI